MSTVTGSSAEPAASAENPDPAWSSSTSMNSSPPVAQYTQNVMTLMTLNWRDAKIASGSIGAGTRSEIDRPRDRSTARKATEAKTPPIPAPSYRDPFPAAASRRAR